MIDREFITRLMELERMGRDGLPEMRELLRGQMGRLLSLAAMGVGIGAPIPASKAKRSKAVFQRSHVADDFPDAEAKAYAVKYWGDKRRPDLIATVEDIAASFHDHALRENASYPDWRAAWRFWVRNQLQYIKPPRGHDLFPVADVAFEQTSAAGWLGRLDVYLSGSADGITPKGFWLPKFGPEPGQPGCKVPAAVFSAVAGRGKLVG